MKINATKIRNNCTKFNQIEFDNDWEDCYIDERCSIAHGRRSKLIDPRMRIEHDQLINRVHTWAIEVIHYYINNNRTK